MSETANESGKRDPRDKPLITTFTPDLRKTHTGYSVSEVFSPTLDREPNSRLQVPSVQALPERLLDRFSHGVPPEGRNALLVGYGPGTQLAGQLHDIFTGEHPLPTDTKEERFRRMPQWRQNMEPDDPYPQGVVFNRTVAITTPHEAGEVPVAQRVDIGRDTLRHDVIAGDAFDEQTWRAVNALFPDGDGFDLMFLNPIDRRRADISLDRVEQTIAEAMSLLYPGGQAYLELPYKGELFTTVRKVVEGIQKSQDYDPSKLTVVSHTGGEVIVSLGSNPPREFPSLRKKTKESKEHNPKDEK